MNREELAALEKEIKAELSALQAKRLDSHEYDEIAALEKDIFALAAEFATVKAEKRRMRQEPSHLTLEEQIAALRAENERLKQIRQLEVEIAALQRQVKRLAGEIRLGGRATTGSPHRRKEIKRLAGEMKVLVEKKHRLTQPIRLRELAKHPRHTPAKYEVSTQVEIPVEMVSLESLVDRNLIEDPGAEWSADEKIDSDLDEATANILGTLSQQEERVIRMRFGIRCEVHTLEEIGQKFHLTRERIRQIETEALRHLRAPERARRLRAMMATR